MANQLDEKMDRVSEGRDVQVIDKQIEVKTGIGSIIFQVFLWLLILPGIILAIKKVKARNYFRQLEQKIQHNASQIDNYLEQRVQILNNAAQLVEKSVNLDKETYEKIAALRSGCSQLSGGTDGEKLNSMAQNVNDLGRGIHLALESYPELRSQRTIEDAMQQNSYLQKEITAAREIYNDSILAWNRDIFAWPTKMIVAAENHYTTRIPFSADTGTRERARENFFG